MDEPVDELYLKWLYDQIGSVKVKNLRRSYWNLARQLYTKEFVWLIPNDDNRVEDGRDLRQEFIEQHDIDVDPNWMELGCSFLEMAIGLSRRLSFEAEGEPRDWFWKLMGNLHLDGCNDGMRTYPHEAVEAILDRVIWRTYKHTGEGGLFPLRHAQCNQQDVELWYQLSAYLLED